MAKRCKTLQEAKKHLAEKQKEDRIGSKNLEIHKLKRGRVNKYVVCSYLEWINEMY